MQQAKWYVLEMEDEKVVVMQLKCRSPKNQRRLWWLDGDGWFYLPNLNQDEEVPYPNPQRFGKLLAIFDDVAPANVFADKMEALIGPLKNRKIILCPMNEG